MFQTSFTLYQSEECMFIYVRNTYKIEYFDRTKFKMNGRNTQLILFMNALFVIKHIETLFELKEIFCTVAVLYF